jgi:hypothetical protein
MMELQEILAQHRKWLYGEGGKRADLCGADLCNADLRDANLRDANLRNANLRNAKNMIKLMGVCLGNRYFKRINDGFENNEYVFTVGLNTLPDNEKFASDERVLCSFPGFHFASKSWCDVNYDIRRYSCLIKIPTKEEYPGIEINEPWATDGKASASAIIIEKVYDMADGEKDVTEKFINYADGKGNRTCVNK